MEVTLTISLKKKSHPKIGRWVKRLSQMNRRKKSINLWMTMPSSLKLRRIGHLKGNPKNLTLVCLSKRKDFLSK